MTIEKKCFKRSVNLLNNVNTVSFNGREIRVIVHLFIMIIPGATFFVQ